MEVDPYIWRWLRRACLGLIVSAFAATASQACRYPPLPDPGRIAGADVVVLATLVRREPGPEVARFDINGSGESEFLTLRTLETYQGEERADWRVLWANTPRGKRDMPHPFFSPVSGSTYVAAFNVEPFDGLMEMAIIRSGRGDETFPQVLLFDPCSDGAAYLFPPDRVVQTESGWEWVR